MSDVSMSHDRLVGMMSNRSDVSTNVQQKKSDRNLGTVSLSFVGKVRAEPSLEKGNESCVFSSKNSCVASEVSSRVSSTVSKVSVRRREITPSDPKVDVHKSAREIKELKEEKELKEKEEKVEETGEVEDVEENDTNSSMKEEEDGEESYPSNQSHKSKHPKKHSIQVKSLESIDVMRKQCPRVMYLECPTDQRDLLSRWNELADKNKEVPYLHRFVKEKEDTVIIYEWEKRTPTVTFLDNLGD